ncbi:MAG TPA: hypothetical protein VNN09_01955 [Candidatus Competibacteraceae bacterium]|nr:hypothetical protein [Candidatus Competibacteraceae bacterium]
MILLAYALLLIGALDLLLAWVLWHRRAPQPELARQLTVLRWVTLASGALALLVGLALLLGPAAG